MYVVILLTTERERRKGMLSHNGIESACRDSIVIVSSSVCEDPFEKNGIVVS